MCSSDLVGLCRAGSADGRDGHAALRSRRELENAYFESGSIEYDVAGIFAPARVEFSVVGGRWKIGGCDLHGS